MLTAQNSFLNIWDCKDCLNSLQSLKRNAKHDRAQKMSVSATKVTLSIKMAPYNR